MRIQYLALALCVTLCTASCSGENLPSSTTRASTTLTAPPVHDEVRQADEASSATTVAADRTYPGAQSTSAPAAGLGTANPAKYLPAEQRFIRQDALSVEESGAALKSQYFDKVVSALQRDAANDPEAQQLGQLYQSEAAKALPAGGRLMNLACGLSVCLGSIRGSSESSLAEWSARFGESKRAPSFSQIDYTTQIGPNEFEGRFIFSTDPGANSLAGRIPSGR